MHAHFDIAICVVGREHSFFFPIPLSHSSYPPQVSSLTSELEAATAAKADAEARLAATDESLDRMMVELETVAARAHNIEKEVVASKAAAAAAEGRAAQLEVRII